MALAFQDEPAPVTIADPLPDPVPIIVVPVGVLTVPPLSTLIIPVLAMPTRSWEEIKELPLLTFNVPGLEEPRSIWEETLAPSEMLSVAVPPPPMMIFEPLNQDEPAPVTLTVPVVPATRPSTPPALLTIPQ